MTEIIENKTKWIKCRKSEILASLPFQANNGKQEGPGILVCRLPENRKDNKKSVKFVGFVGSPIWPEVEERIGICLQEDQPESAAETLLLASAISILEYSSVEGGDIAIVSGSGNLASALLTVANIQGLRCIQKKAVQNQIQTINCDKIVDLNLQEWRKKLTDTDNKIRGNIVFFELSQDRKELSELLPNLGQMEKLVICPAVVPMRLQFNAYRDIHKRSAEIRSWALIPGTCVFSKFPKAYLRAQQLIKYRWKTKKMQYWIEFLYS